MLWLPTTPWLRAVLGLDAGKFGADLLPVALQFFGQQHGKRGHVPWPISALWMNSVT